MRPPDAEAPDFRTLQAQLAAHLRDPAAHAGPPGIEPRRLAIYRELLYANVEAAVSTAFPVIRRITPDAAWHARVRDFYARHRCTAPQYNRIAGEFVQFLESGRGAHADDAPFLAELAHYEWVELALGIADVEAPPAHASDGEILDAPVVVSPLAWTLSYTWPVHRIGPAYQPVSPPDTPTWLVVYRDAQDDVRFMEINAVTARFLQLAAECAGATGRLLLGRIAGELAQPEGVVIEAGRAMLVALRERGCIA